MTIGEAAVAGNINVEAVGRTVLEAEVQELVRERAGDYRAQGVLAASAGGGGDLAGVLSSLFLRLLEDGATSPFEVEAFLVVGGGARSTSFRGRRGMPWRFSGVLCWRRRSWSCRRAS